MIDSDNPLHSLCSNQSTTDADIEALRGSADFNEPFVTPRSSTKSGPSYERPLLLALKHNLDISVIRKLIDCGSDVLLSHSLRQQSPLGFALIENKEPEIIYELLEGDLEKCSWWKELTHWSPVLTRKSLAYVTLLEFAAQVYSQSEVLKKLVSMGKLLTVTAVQRAAAQNPSLEVLKYLLENVSLEKLARGSRLPSPTINQQIEDPGYPPKDLVGKSFIQRLLEISVASNSNPEIVKYLIELGADPNAIHKTHSYEVDLSPLALAIKHNDNECIVSELISAGANPNEKLYGCETEFGIKHRHSGTMEKPAGNPDALYAYSSLLLFALARAYNPKVIEVLLEAGADPNVGTDNPPMTPLTFCFHKVKYARREEFRWMGRSYASKSEFYHQAIKLFLKYGADPKNDNKGNPIYPLFEDIAYERFDVIRDLIKAGARTECPSRGTIFEEINHWDDDYWVLIKSVKNKSKDDYLNFYKEVLQ